MDTGLNQWQHCYIDWWLTTSQALTGNILMIQQKPFCLCLSQCFNHENSTWKSHEFFRSSRSWKFPSWNSFIGSLGLSFHLTTRNSIASSSLNNFSRPRSSIKVAANHFIIKPRIQFLSDRNFGLLVHGWNWHERGPRIVYPSSYKTALNASQCSINFDREFYFRNFRMNFPSLYLCLHSSHLRTATNLWM